MDDDDIPQSVLLFVKAPEAGRVKTRLARTIGDDIAVNFYKHCVSDILRSLNQTGIAIKIFASPAESLLEIADWLGDRYEYLPQEGDDLGYRMENAFRQVFSIGVSKAVLIGSDIPDFPADMIRQAFEALEHHPAVIAPASDGGYCLIGFDSAGFLPDIFHTVAWSTPKVFEDTLAIFGQKNYPVHILPMWYDIDNYEDMLNFMQRCRQSDNNISSAYSYLCGSCCIATTFTRKEAAMDFKEVINSRRAVNFFDPSKDVSETLLREMIEMAAKTPSSFNLQPWNLMIVKHPEEKAALQKLAWNQPKVSEAPVILIALADRDAWKKGHPFVERNFKEMVKAGSMSENQYQWFLDACSGLYGSSPERQQAFACKNTGFFAMSLMLAAKSLGLDTHPMDGFDHDGVRKAFRIPDNYWIPLLIAVGYFKADKTLLPPKWRKTFEEIVVNF